MRLRIEYTSLQESRIPLAKPCATQSPSVADPLAAAGSHVAHPDDVAAHGLASGTHHV